MEFFADYFRELYEATGWNFVMFYEQYEYDRFLEGMWVSIKLIFASLLFSLVVGFVGAWAQGAKSKIVRYGISGYIQLFRALRRWSSAVGRGYRAGTVGMVLADRVGDSGHLLQGGRAFALVDINLRRALLVGRLAQGHDPELYAGRFECGRQGVMLQVRSHHLILGPEEIDNTWFAGVDTVGITSGASTPEISVQAVVEYLRQLGVPSVEEIDGVVEEVEFQLPAAVQ